MSTHGALTEPANRGGLAEPSTNLPPSAGWLQAACDYRRRAEEHRPTCPDQLASEVRRLHRTGLKPIDIATALRLDPAAVQTLIGRDAA